MKPRFAIGNSTFSSLREQGSHFVDKSMLITDVVRNHSQVLLLPRPRRFGKTLAMTMLQSWFTPGHDNSALFSDLAVWHAGEDVRARFGRHPVIFLTFKDVKKSDWPRCRNDIADAIGRFCGTIVNDMARANLDDVDAQRFARLRAATATEKELQTALLDLSAWLHRSSGE